jgi:hypothetical protein
VMVNRSDRDPPSLNDCSSLRALRRNEARVSGIHQGPQAAACKTGPDINLRPHLFSHHTKETLHIGRRPYNSNEHGLSR